MAKSSPASGFGQGKGGANMDSRQVSQICKGISEWYSLNKENLKNAPEQHGIYIFRMAQSRRFGRLANQTSCI